MHTFAFDMPTQKDTNIYTYNIVQYTMKVSTVLYIPDHYYCHDMILVMSHVSEVYVTICLDVLKVAKDC